jgi:hypothetical protein
MISGRWPKFSQELENQKIKSYIFIAAFES